MSNSKYVPGKTERLLSPSPIYAQASLGAVTMDFPTAIEAVMDGKKITKLEWNNAQIYGVLLNNILVLRKPILTSLSEYEYHPWTISAGDLFGTDWVVIP